MSRSNPRNHATRFKAVSADPLSRCVVGAKVPIDVEQAIRALPSEKRSEWIRRVLTEAARKELSGSTV